MEIEPLPKTLVAVTFAENGDEHVAGFAKEILRFMQLKRIFGRHLEAHHGRSNQLREPDDLTGVP